MALAYGHLTTLLGAFEATSAYDTVPATGWQRLPFVTANVGGDVDLEADEVLGFGSREPAAATPGNMRVEGDLTVPFDLRNLAFWLQAAFGEPATGSGSSVFNSGGAVPSFSLSLELPAVPSYRRISGLKLNNLSVSLDPAETVKNMTVSMIGRREVLATATAAASPTVLPFSRLPGQSGAVLIDAQLGAAVVGGELTFSNNLTADLKEMDGTRFYAEPSPGVTSCTGSIVTRFRDHSILDKADAGAPVNLDFSWNPSPGIGLTILVSNCRLRRTRLPINGPGGIEATFEFIAGRPATGSMVTATLRTGA